MQPPHEIRAEGVLYVALGDAYVAMALNSARTLRETGCRVPVSIVSSVPLTRVSLGLQDELAPLIWQHLELAVERNREVKTCAIDYSPFDRTLMVDCDTVILRDVNMGFGLLDHFDVCIKLNQLGQVNHEKGSYHLNGIGNVADLPHWNSGVLLFRRNDEACDFFARWNDAYRRLHAPWDQIGLVQAVFETEARVLSLDDRWNSQGKQPSRQAYIHHYTSAVTPQLQARICDAAAEVEGFDIADIRRFLNARFEDRMRRRGKAAADRQTRDRPLANLPQRVVASVRRGRTRLRLGGRA